MPTSTVSLEVTSDHSVPVEPLGGTATVLNVSGGTLYYADNPQVSASNNQGSLTAGQSATFTSQAWVRSASLSTVTVALASATGATTMTVTTVDGPQSALGSSLTPAALTMKMKSHQRHVDPVPPANLTSPLLTHHFDPDGYDLSALTVFAKTLPAATAGSGSFDNTHEAGLGITASVSGWTQDCPWSGGPLRVPYMVSYVRVTAHTGTDEVRVGWRKDATNYACAYYDGTNYGTRINGVSTAHSKTVTNLPAVPFTLACIYAWPDVIGAFIFDDGNIFPFGSSVQATDTRSTTEAPNWQPFTGVTLAANDTLRISQMRSGYLGGVAVSNPQAITYADGTPFTRDGSGYFTATIQGGVSSWFGSWTCIVAIDLLSYRARMVSILFFQVGTYIGALCPTKAVFDSANDRFLLISSAWGMLSSGINTQPYFTATTQNITQPGAYFIGTTQMSLPTTATYGGAYDMDLRFDVATGLWRLVGAESSGSAHGPAMWTSPDLNTWTLVAADHATSGTTEGIRWAKVGGQWWILGSNTGTGIEYYNASLAHQGTIHSAWNDEDPGGTGIMPLPGNWSSPVPHPTLVAVHDDHPVAQTRYWWVTMSFTTTNIDTSGVSMSRGGLLVCEATQTPAGHEFPIRRLWRAA